MLRQHYKLAGFQTMPTEKEQDKFFKQLDVDGSGAVDFDEFCDRLLHSRKDKMLKVIEEYCTNVIGLKLF